MMKKIESKTNKLFYFKNYINTGIYTYGIWISLRFLICSSSHHLLSKKKKKNKIQLLGRGGALWREMVGYS
jgi:hypothetical protein